MSNFERPKVSTCRDCKKVIEWRDATNGSGKKWPYDPTGEIHFATCTEKKPFIAKCKFCQQEIEWKDRKPMNKNGTSHLESCNRNNSATASFHDTEPLF